MPHTAANNSNNTRSFLRFSLFTQLGFIFFFTVVLAGIAEAMQPRALRRLDKTEDFSIDRLKHNNLLLDASKTISATGMLTDIEPYGPFDYVPPELVKSSSMRFADVSVSSEVAGIDTVYQKIEGYKLNEDLSKIKPMITKQMEHAWFGVEAFLKEYSFIKIEDKTKVDLLSSLAWNMVVEGNKHMLTAKESAEANKQVLQIPKAFFNVLEPRLVKMMAHFLYNLNLMALRVKKDQNDIKGLFFSGTGATSFKITDIEPTGNDVHNSGRSALFLTFNSGTKQQKVIYKTSSISTNLIYMGNKPSFAYSSHKTLNLDEFVSFSDFLNYLGKFDSKSALPTCKVLSINDPDCLAESYGYVEFMVTEANMADEEKWLKASYNAGRAAAQAYLLQIGDLHFENVLMLPEGPVLIDTEIRDPIRAEESICEALARSGLADKNIGGMVNDRVGNDVKKNMPLYNGKMLKYDESSFKMGFKDIFELVYKHKADVEKWVKQNSVHVVWRTLPISTPFFGDILKWAKYYNYDFSKLADYMAKHPITLSTLYNKKLSHREGRADIAVLANDMTLIMQQMKELSIPTFYSLASEKYIEVMTGPNKCVKIPIGLTEETNQELDGLQETLRKELVSLNKFKKFTGQTFDLHEMWSERPTTGPEAYNYFTNSWAEDFSTRLEWTNDYIGQKNDVATALSEPPCRNMYQVGSPFASHNQQFMVKQIENTL